jgi:cyclic-di-GMP-binding protein
VPVIVPFFWGKSTLQRRRENGRTRVNPGVPAAHFHLFLCHRLFYAAAMPSFDIVSQVNSMEIENAVNQAKKELANRFDFKGSKAEITLEKDEIKLTAEDQFKIRTLAEIVVSKLAKRNVSMKNIEQAEPDVSPLGHARQVIKIKQGIETPIAKQITGFIRDGKFKVTTQIQGSEVRVTGKSRDELQTVIGAVRAKEFPVALQFQNFRD